MEIRQATNFLELLELQKILDSKVKSCRERDPVDIKLSMIAEIIEFNEECEEYTHKTWKTDKKVFSIEKAKKESIDILFFLAQLTNVIFKDYKPSIYTGDNLTILAEIFDYSKISVAETNLKNETLQLIYVVSNFSYFSSPLEWVRLFECLKRIYKMLGMTEEEMYKRHFDKWKENYYERIGKEWN